MPVFQRKVSTTENKLGAIQERLAELQEDLRSKEKSISDKKDDLAVLLGKTALQPNVTEFALDLKSTKAALAKLVESREDISQQITFLTKEKSRLESELSEAVIRESPAKLESEATEFNKLLDQSLETLSVLQSLFRNLKEKERNFHNLLDERQKALNKVGRVEGLEIKEGLGRLAFAGSPYAYSLQLPGEFTGQFVDVLKVYQEKVKGFESFQAENPDFQKQIDATNERDRMDEQNKFAFLSKIKRWAS
jgi:hypothetical protein